MNAEVLENKYIGIFFKLTVVVDLKVQSLCYRPNGNAVVY